MFYGLESRLPLAVARKRSPRGHSRMALLAEAVSDRRQRVVEIPCEGAQFHSALGAASPQQTEARCWPSQKWEDTSNATGTPAGSLWAVATSACSSWKNDGRSQDLVILVRDMINPETSVGLLWSLLTRPTRGGLRPARDRLPHSRGLSVRVKQRYAPHYVRVAFTHGLRVSTVACDGTCGWLVWWRPW